jgi:hypothetical protein
MKNHKFAGFIFVITFLISLSPALAQPTFTGDQAQFLADNPGAVSQGFLSHLIPQGEFTNCDSPVNRNSNDECFTPVFILPGLELTINQFTASGLFVLFGPDFGGSGSPSNVLGSSIFNASLDVSFPVTGANAVGVLLGCLQAEKGNCDQAITVTVFGLDGDFLGQTTVQGGSLFNTFLGVESTEPVARISIILPGSSENVQGVTRVWFALAHRPIPTLSEWGMIAAAAGLMMAGVFYAVKKRRAAV